MAVFSLVQFKTIEFNSPETVVAITFDNPPTPGNLFCWAGFIGDGLISLQDGLGNQYTLSTHSPLETNNLLAYLIAPANPDPTVTATWATPQDFSTIFLAEFHFTCTSVTYDKDAVQPLTSADGLAIDSPVISPRITNSLLFAYCNPTDIISAPTTGNPAGPWIGLDINILSGVATEYCLDSSSPTPINFTGTVINGSYRAMSMAFSPSSGKPTASTGSILRGPHRGSRVTPPYNP